MLILDLWGISFHPAVVVGLGNDLLFNFIVGHCGELVSFIENLDLSFVCWGIETGTSSFQGSFE